MFYAIYSGYGKNHIDASAQMLAFGTKKDRAKAIDRINAAHACDTAEACWPVTYREACEYKNIRTFFNRDYVREEVIYNASGHPLFHYWSREFMSW